MSNRVNWIVYDTEDNSEEMQLRNLPMSAKRVLQIGAMAHDGATYYSNGNVASFLKWLDERAPCVVWAHNQQYDLGNLFGRALDQMDVTLVGSRLIRARWGKVVFKDSMNIWPMALKKLGVAFKLAKKRMDVRSRAYVMRDVEILHRAMTFAYNQAESFGVQRFPSTIGSLAVGIWRELGGENWFDDSNASLASYYGGRVEIFNPRISGDIYYTDINSLYPHALTLPFPTELQAQKDLGEWLGVAHVKMQIPDTWLGLLPVRDEEGRIYYPTGTLTGTWTTPELKNAIAHGAKLKAWHWGIGSGTTEHYYKDFVERVYRLRLRSDTEAEKLFWKLLLNNLYGQLAHAGKITESRDWETHWHAGGVKYGSKLLVEHSIPLPRHTNYLHASLVTGYARVRLHEHLKQLNCYDLCYCDTDSLLFKGKPPFPISTNLGDMKLEAHLPQGEAQAWSPKVYRFGDFWKAKGVPRANAQQFIVESVTEYWQPNKLRTACAYYDRGNRRQLSIWRKVIKERSGEYDRKVLLDGVFMPKKVIAVSWGKEHI